MCVLYTQCVPLPNYAVCKTKQFMLLLLHPSLYSVQYTVYCMQELDAVSLQSGKFGFKGTVKHISYSFLKGR